MACRSRPPSWTGHSGAIPVSPGPTGTWYDIEVRFSNGGGGAGRNGARLGRAAIVPNTTTTSYPNLPWTKGFGYALNPTNPNSDNAADYPLMPIDNGSMNCSARRGWT